MMFGKKIAGFRRAAAAVYNRASVKALRDAAPVTALVSAGSGAVFYAMAVPLKESFIVAACVMVAGNGLGLLEAEYCCIRERRAAAKAARKECGLK